LQVFHIKVNQIIKAIVCNSLHLGDLVHYGTKNNIDSVEEPEVNNHEFQITSKWSWRSQQNLRTTLPCDQLKEISTYLYLSCLIHLNDNNLPISLLWL